MIDSWAKVEVNGSQKKEKRHSTRRLARGQFKTDPKKLLWKNDIDKG